MATRGKEKVAYATLEVSGNMVKLSKAAKIGEEVVTINFSAPTADAVTFTNGLDANKWYNLMLDGAFRNAVAAVRATQGPVRVKWLGSMTPIMQVPRLPLASILSNFSLKIAAMNAENAKAAKTGGKVRKFKGLEKYTRVIDAAVEQGLITAHEYTAPDGTVTRMFTPVPE